MKMNDRRMIAYNAHMTDDEGVIWCMVVENEAGYRPMTGSDPLQAPWYLARLDNHRDEDGKVNFTTLWENAKETVDSWNKDQGYSSRDVMQILASSHRAQNRGEEE